MTGANRGIGKSIATRLASDGFIVALLARNEESLAVVQSEIEANGGQASTHVCDLSDGKGLTSTIESIVKQYSRLDVIVNNAGMTKDGLMLRMSEEDFDDVINVNLRSRFCSV